MKWLKIDIFFLTYIVMLYSFMPLVSKKIINPEITRPAILQKLKEKSFVSSINNELDLIDLYSFINNEEIKGISAAFKLPIEQRKMFFVEFMENFKNDFTQNLVERIRDINIMKDYQKRDELVGQYRRFLRGVPALAHKGLFGKLIEQKKQKYLWEHTTVKPLAKNFEKLLTDLLPKKVKLREKPVEPRESDDKELIDEEASDEDDLIEKTRDIFKALQKNLKKDMSLITFFYHHLEFLLKSSAFALQEEVNVFINKLNECFNFMQNELEELKMIAKSESQETINLFFKKISSDDYKSPIKDKLKEGSQAFRDAIEAIKISICKRFNIYIKRDILEDSNSIVKELLQYTPQQIIPLKFLFSPNSVKELWSKVSQVEKELEKKLDKSKQEYTDTVRDICFNKIVGNRKSSYDGWSLELGLYPELLDYQKFVKKLSNFLFSEHFQNKIIETFNKSKIKDPEELKKILIIFYGIDFEKLLPQKLREFYQEKSVLTKEEEQPGIQVRLFTKNEIKMLENLATDLSKSIDMMDVLTQITLTNENLVKKIRQQKEEIQTLLEKKDENIAQQFPEVRLSVENYCKKIIDETTKNFELILNDIRDFNQYNFEKLKKENTFNFDFDLDKPLTKAEEHVVNFLKIHKVSSSWVFKTKPEKDIKLKKKILEDIRILKGREKAIKEKEVCFESLKNFEEIFQLFISLYMSKDKEAIKRRKQVYLEKEDNKEYDIDFEQVEKTNLDDIIKEIKNDKELDEYKIVSKYLTSTFNSKDFKEMLYDYIINKAKIADGEEFINFFSHFYGSGEQLTVQCTIFADKNKKYFEESLSKSLDKFLQEKSLKKKKPLPKKSKPLPKKTSEPIKKDPLLVSTAPKKPLPQLPKKKASEVQKKKLPEVPKAKKNLKKIKKFEEPFIN